MGCSKICPGLPMQVQRISVSCFFLSSRFCNCLVKKVRGSSYHHQENSVKSRLLTQSPVAPHGEVDRVGDSIHGVWLGLGNYLTKNFYHPRLTLLIFCLRNQAFSLGFSGYVAISCCTLYSNPMPSQDI